MADEIPVESLQVTLVAHAGAPAPDTLVAALRRDAIDVEIIMLDDATELAPPTRPIVIAWLPQGADARQLQGLVTWRARAPQTTRLIGCSPDGGVADSERALAAGFDDFMAGRTSPRELSARLRALKRRLRPTVPRSGERLRFGRLVLDGSRHELWIDMRRVPVTAMEMAILGALIEAQGRALTRAEPLDRVWGEDELDVGLRAVDNLVCRLRRKLGDPRLLVTVRGVGFRVADK